MLRWLCVLTLLYSVSADNVIFRVNGGLEAGSDGDFTIKGGETLVAVVDYDYTEVRNNIVKAKVALSQTDKDVRIGVSEKVTDAKREAEESQDNLQSRRRLTDSTVEGFKYNHMLPRNATTTKMYLPTGDNVMIMDRETGNFTTLTGTLLKNIVPLIEDVTYLRNAMKVMGALFGLDMSELDVALRGDKETYILLERIKRGDIPLFVPGAMYINKEFEVNVEGWASEPQYCPAFSGEYSTTSWIRTELWNNITNTDDLNSTRDANLSNRWDHKDVLELVNTKGWAITDSQDYSDYDAEVNNRTGEIKSKICV